MFQTFDVCVAAAGEGTIIHTAFVRGLKWHKGITTALTLNSWPFGGAYLIPFSMIIDHPAEKWLVNSKGLWFFRRTRLSERGLTRDWSVVVGPPGCAAAAADSVLLLKRKGKVNKQYSSRQVWILPSSSLLCIFIIVLMNWVCGHERIVGTQEHTTVIDNFAHYNC